MSLPAEWRARVEQWQCALQSLFFHPLAAVPMEAAFTYEQLTPDQAKRLEYAPIAAGERWGAKWEYAWFRGRVVLPPEADGEMIVLHAGEPTPQWENAEPYGEWRWIVNGAEPGSRDWAHVDLRLTQHGVPGTTYDLLAEAFGGPTRCGAGGGPALPGVPVIKPTPPKQRTMADVMIDIWREEVFQLWLDVQTLLELRDQLDRDSLRLDEVDAGLREYTLIADPELPWAEFLPTVSMARERLRPLLECRNGSTAPTLFCVGHSHLDVVYQWPWAETERKVARTFSNQLTLLNDYSEYRYLQSMPVLYDAAKRLYPEIYERVKSFTDQGRWITEGGMWTEADTNITGGESLIRQFLYGRRFFREEFNVESIFAWLPDVFGYSGALPQIMAGCGMKYFGSSKIFWKDNGADPFPYISFWWEGIDGTRILSHFPRNYGSDTSPRNLNFVWNDRPQKDGLHSRMVFYGHSDGGGGCTRKHLEFLRRQTDLEGLPRTRHATPVEFFQDLEKTAARLPAYVGEIYFPDHRGTYTSQARLKLGNRRCEFALREAEIWSSLATALQRGVYPANSLEVAWKKTLFNQFHDILPGSCIQRAAEEAEALYAEALAEAQSVLGTALKALPAGGSKGWTAFNSLSWNRNALVALPENAELEGSQNINGVHYAEVTLPPLGWSPIKPQSTGSGVTVTENSLENAFLKIELNARGEIIHCFDKETRRDLAAGSMNAFRMFRDTPHHCEAWDISSHYELQPVAMDEPAAFEVMADGPLAAVLRVRRRLHHSEMEQEIWLRRDSRRVDFRTRIVWRERHKLLKVCFPVGIRSTEAMHEIQFGYIKRPTHRSRPHDQDRYEVCQQKWSAIAEENAGVALLNDCKYGISTFENSLNLTLLRASLAPDEQADQGEHEFTYSLYSWNGPFSSSRVAQEAYDLNTPVQIVHGEADTASLIHISADNIILDTLKLSEDGSGDLVARLYESLRTTTRCCLSTALPVLRVFESDMLEVNRTELAFSAYGVDLLFRPFEIKTLRFQLAKK